MIFSRQPSGFALGALAGTYPAVALGLPPAVGPCMFDDFTADHATKAKSLYGELDWLENTIGAATTVTTVQPSTFAEIGVMQVTTPATANRGATFTQGAIAPLFRFPPIGSVWACKIRLTSGTTAYELWSGFSSVAAGRVATADATAFVGVRAVGANLFGVVKSGAATEATIDLGMTVEGATWQAVGFEVLGTSAVPLFQFFRFNVGATERGIHEREDIGAPVGGITILAGLMPVALGILTTSVTAKTAQIDYWAWGGRVAR